MAYQTKPAGGNMAEYARRMFMFYIPVILGVALVSAVVVKLIG